MLDNVKLFVTICFHYSEQRLPFLYQVVNSLLEITAKEVKIIIHTNVNSDLEDWILDKPNTYVKVVENLGDPFLLTWAHKSEIQSFIESDYTHFCYLEDDMELTESLVRYWITNKHKFEFNELNFIPGFLRVEYRDKEIFSVDFLKRQRIEENNTILIDGEKFISPYEPYHGIMFMDRTMAKIHMDGKNNKVDTCSYMYGIREKANVCYSYENVPKGFSNKCLLPLDNIESCLIHHVSNNYCVDKNTEHGKLVIKDLFY